MSSISSLLFFQIDYLKMIYLLIFRPNFSQDLENLKESQVFL